MLISPNKGKTRRCKRLMKNLPNLLNEKQGKEIKVNKQGVSLLTATQSIYRLPFIKHRIYLTSSSLHQTAQFNALSRTLPITQHASYAQIYWMHTRNNMLLVCWKGEKEGHVIPLVLSKGSNHLGLTNQKASACFHSVQPHHHRGEATDISSNTYIHVWPGSQRGSDWTAILKR